jgi:predicted nuclease of predicted toxin-antitoxin system
VKRVLFDEDMPRQLRRDLPDFHVRTVQEEGWSSVQNGELLRRACDRFDVLVTADQRLQHQQNIPQFPIGVVVIAARDTRLPHLRSMVSELRAAIIAVAPGTVVVVGTTAKA